MRRINRIAETYGCAVVMIGHLNKTSSGEKLYRGLGSIDIAAIARSVLMIARDETKEEPVFLEVAICGGRTGKCCDKL